MALITTDEVVYGFLIVWSCYKPTLTESPVFATVEQSPFFKVSLTRPASTALVAVANKARKNTIFIMWLFCYCKLNGDECLCNSRSGSAPKLEFERKFPDEGSSYRRVFNTEAQKNCIFLCNLILGCDRPGISQNAHSLLFHLNSDS